MRFTKGAAFHLMLLNRKFLPYFCRLSLAFAISYICYAAFSQPSGDPPFPGFDKLLHASAFFILALLSEYSLFKLSKQSVWAIIIALMIYGLFIEITQSFLSYRDSSWRDLIANMTGIMLYFISPQKIRIVFHSAYAHNLKPSS